MRFSNLLTGVVVILATALSPGSLHAGGEIHGTVQAVDGRTLTGPIRWDRNENFWDDRLDVMRQSRTKVDDGGFKLKLFGLTIGDTDDYVQFGLSVPFGELTSLEPIDESTARIVLRSKEEIIVRAGSSDLGSRMRALIIDDADAGRVELEWHEIERVAFFEGKQPGRDAERLFGTVITSDGELTGFIGWDRDESLADDMLDGNDPEGVEHEIALGKVHEIERLDRDSSRVTLVDGTTLTLGDTNDVGRGHRGVYVTQPGVGGVDVAWGDVERVRFSDPPASVRYGSFAGSRPLQGTIHLRGGGTAEGRIVWDLDESLAFETLDARSGSLDYAIPFINVTSIRRIDRRASEVTLRNGDVLRLSGSNDVDDDNHGIRVTDADGSETILDWETIERVDFR